MKTRHDRTFVILFVWLALCAVVSADPPSLSGPVQKVVLISIDTLRADYLGCYTPGMETSPELDQFASKNVICLNVTSQSATTAISHKSIFYSVYPSIHKTSIRTVPEEKLKSPMELIQAAGFKTAAFTGGGQLSRSFGFARGFDTYREPQTNPDDKHKITETEQAAFDWLDKHYSGKFFLFLHTFEVHCPYDPPEAYFQKWSAWYQGQIQKGNCYPVDSLRRRPTTTDYKYVRSLYSAEVNYADSFVGDVFRKLKALGIYDQTLIVFLSDHGESLGEQGYIGHNRLYETQLHVPLILHIPDVSSTRIDAPIESLDVMPTIFDLLQIRSRSYQFQGMSLMPLIRKQGAADKNRPLISEEMGRVRVRIGDLALSFSPDGTNHEELYNLRRDPQEMENIADKNPKTAEKMKLPYFRMMTASKDLSAQFILDPGRNPAVTVEANEQLRALGYVAH